MGIGIYVLESLIFARVVAMIAILPISGSAVASMITVNTATEAGQSDLMALVMLYDMVQILFGVPVPFFS